MSFDYFSILSNGVGSDDTPTDSEWAILGISYGLITDSLSEYVASGIVGMMLEIGRSGIRAFSKLLMIGR